MSQAPTSVHASAALPSPSSLSAHPSLARLAPAAGRLTLGLELPLDNDWGVERGRAALRCA
ncbi:hypothetical protein ACFZCF_15260 [Streptomyces sp. NPDC007945]|uniref:hypothetical protein n=1 Tax=Streptomyces sp. NPDC007945 TaxID=3364797 RepID=UPI0036EAFCA9